MNEPKSEVAEWLLAEDNPSVRYLTLRDLLDRPPADPELASAKRSIMLTGVMPEIVAKISVEEYRQMRQD